MRRETSIPCRTPRCGAGLAAAQLHIWAAQRKSKTDYVLTLASGLLAVAIVRGAMESTFPL